MRGLRHFSKNSYFIYEIIPNPIFLDQRETYCMLIPSNWRDEVQTLVGKKKTSFYTFMFLVFLRYAFELIIEPILSSDSATNFNELRWDPNQYTWN